MIESSQPPFCQADVSGSAFTHLGLFEGIGGFSLAARWMGWKTLAWCEWNEFGQRILRFRRLFERQ
jgi:site-specific DNA-cytosine methylase